MHTEKQIIRSWRKNAEPWIRCVQEQQIESRRLTTDNAIIRSILSVKGKTVLDIGCGEGWLCRALLKHGYKVTGIDAVDRLIKSAAQKGKGAGIYRVLAYENLSQIHYDTPFDIAVCNFSLIGKNSVDTIFGSLPKMLSEKGILVVQTLHPLQNAGADDYRDGWRSGSWEGFGPDFDDPPYWYFRTTGSWLKQFTDNGFRIVKIKEPVHPENGKLLSLIIIGTK